MGLSYPRKKRRKVPTGFCVGNGGCQYVPAGNAERDENIVAGATTGALNGRWRRDLTKRRSGSCTTNVLNRSKQTRSDNSGRYEYLSDFKRRLL
jgi:hypothetical protein